MNSFDKMFLSKNLFFRGILIGDYENNRDIVSSIPNVPGVYVAILNSLPEKKFLIEGSGGFFKKKNPNVSKEFLLKNWVDGTRILYIGKAGGTDKKGKISNATLQDRITAFIKFGYGCNIGHWGGRLIWQLQYRRGIFIYWRTCFDLENPVEIEKRLIREFEDEYGKMPFANLRH